MDQTLFIVGINHRSAAVALRERLAFAEDEIVAALGRLRESSPAVLEAALISTCNRVEVVGVASDTARAADETLKFLAADRSVERAAFADVIYSSAGPRRRASSVPRRCESRFDGGWRAADIGPAQDCLRAGVRGAQRRPDSASRVPQGVHGRQARAQGHAYRSWSGLRQFRGSRACGPDFRHVERQDRDADGCGQDGGVDRPPVERARNRVAADHLAHFRSRSRAGARTWRHRGAVRQLQAVPQDGGRAYRFGRIDQTGAGSRRIRVRDSRTPLPADVSDRHGRAAQFRRAAERAAKRLSVRHRRSRRAG